MVEEKSGFRVDVALARKCADIKGLKQSQLTMGLN